MISTIINKDILLNAARDIFGTMIFLDIHEGPDVRVPMCHCSLLGIVTFTGDTEGCLGFRLDTVGARTVAASMLGMDDPDALSNRDVSDAIGEVTNMLMGCTKTALQDQFSAMRMSIPTVIKGYDIECHLRKKEILVSVGILIANQFPAELSLLYPESE